MRVRSRTSLFSDSRIGVDIRPRARERASGTMRSFRQTRRADGLDLDSDPLNLPALNLAAMISSSGQRDQPVEPRLRESASDPIVGYRRGGGLLFVKVVGWM